MPKKKSRKLVEVQPGVYMLRDFEPPKKRLDNSRLEQIIRMLIKRKEEDERAARATSKAVG